MLNLFRNDNMNFTFRTARFFCRICEKPVCLFGLFSITFAVVTAMVNVGGLFRDGLLTQFFYVSFDSLTSVTVLCVITAMTAYQARLLSRKRRRQQNMVNA